MIKKIAFISFTVFLLSLVSCPPPPAVFTRPKVDWTIMVWLDGDNNLETYAIADFNEMEYGLYLAGSGDVDIDDKISIVVQFDRIAGYESLSHDDGGDWTDTRRYWVRPDPDSSETGGFVSQVVPTPGEVNMGDAYALRSFIQYGKSSFPADHYALILWNHGSGVRSATSVPDSAGVKGISYDETAGYDCLYTGEITDALTGAESVDVIGFDACLMGMVEIGYEYRPDPGKFGADYMVASTANEQGDGWEYQKILNRLKGPGTDGEGDTCYDVASLTADQLASVIVKEYEDFTNPSQSTQVMAAYDLSKAADVKEKLDVLAAAVSGKKAAMENIRGSAGATVTCDYFNELLETEWRDWPHFDLYDLALRISADTTNFSAGERAAATAVKDSVDSMVISSWGGSHYVNDFVFVQGQFGLGFFFPDGDRLYGSDYHYEYQWWYTNLNTESAYGNGFLYGKIDFCQSGSASSSVENWKDLLEYWFDPSNTYNYDNW